MTSHLLRRKSSYNGLRKASSPAKPCSVSRSSISTVSPARAFTATDSDGNFYTAHEFLAGTRIYQVLVLTTKSNFPSGQDNGQFLNSFVILGTPTPALKCAVRIDPRTRPRVCGNGFLCEIHRQILDQSLPTRCRQ